MLLRALVCCFVVLDGCALPHVSGPGASTENGGAGGKQAEPVAGRGVGGEGEDAEPSVAGSSEPGEAGKGGAGASGSPAEQPAMEKPAGGSVAMPAMAGTGGTSGMPAAASKSALGAKCRGGAECASGECVDDVCCEQHACGTCQACNTKYFPGKCSNQAGTDLDSCAGANSCGQAGECLKVEPQSQTLTKTASFGANAADDRLAQSFTVSTAGKLLEIRMPLHCSSAGLLRASISTVGPNKDGVVQPSDVTSSELDNSLSTQPLDEQDDGMIALRLTQAFPVTVGQVFAIVLAASRASGSDACTVGYGDADFYPDGTMFRTGPANTSSSGAEFTAQKADLAFKVLIQTD